MSVVVVDMKMRSSDAATRIVVDSFLAMQTVVVIVTVMRYHTTLHDTTLPYLHDPIFPPSPSPPRKTAIKANQPTQACGEFLPIYTTTTH